MSACVKCGHDPAAVVSASWMLLVERELESGNRHTFNVGGSRWRYGRDRDAWQLEFRAFRLLRKIPKATTKRRVTLTRFYDGRQREWDADNLAMGAKLVVDALVREGLLADDRREFAEIHYKQVRQAPRGTGLLIEELGAPEAGISKGAEVVPSVSSEPHTERSPFVRESDTAPRTFGTETAGGR